MDLNRKRPCICGYSRSLSWHHHILLLFQDITLKCPRCGRSHRFHMTWFVNEDFGSVREENKFLDDCKMELWRKC